MPLSVWNMWPSGVSTIDSGEVQPTSDVMSRGALKPDVAESPLGSGPSPPNAKIADSLKTMISLSWLASAVTSPPNGSHLMTRSGGASTP